MNPVAKVRKYFEEKLKQRYSAKEEKKMKKAFAKEFHYKKSRDSSFSAESWDHRSDRKRQRDKIKKSVERIPKIADNINVPPTAFAAFCHVELLIEAVGELEHADSKVEGHEFTLVEKGIGSHEYLEGTIIMAYDDANYKILNSIEIAKAYDLGPLNPVESLSKLIEERIRKVSVIAEILKEGDNLQKAKKGLKDLQNEIEEEDSQIQNRIEAITQADVEKWFK